MREPLSLEAAAFSECNFLNTASIYCLLSYNARNETLSVSNHRFYFIAANNKYKQLVCVADILFAQTTGQPYKRSSN